MNAGMKMLMISNRNGSGGESRSGGSGGRNESRGNANMGMENAYNEMRGENGRSEMEMRGDGGRSEMEMRRGGGARNEMGYGRSEMEGAYGRSGGARNEMGYGRSAYDEMEERMGGDMESRRGGQRRRRDSRGRFISEGEYMGAEMGGYGEMEGHYPMYPFVPPIYEEERVKPRQRIGFALESESKGNEYKQDAGIPSMGNEMAYRTSAAEMGHATGRNTKLTKEMAEEWMRGIQNEDGTKGPHWTLEQAKQVMAQRGVQADPLSFWVVLNSMYADYCKTFKKYGVGDKLDFYIDVSKDFLNDKDAGEGKVVAYFENIVKH